MWSKLVIMIVLYAGAVCVVNASFLEYKHRDALPDGVDNTVKPFQGKDGC